VYRNRIKLFSLIKSKYSAVNSIVSDCQQSLFFWQRELPLFGFTPSFFEAAKFWQYMQVLSICNPSEVLFPAITMANKMSAGKHTRRHFRQMQYFLAIDASYFVLSGGYPGFAMEF
jgi:hypothetical protein